MAHILRLAGSSSMVVTLETFSSSEAIIAVYANPVHTSNTAKLLPLYGFKEAILRRVSSFGSTPKPNRCILNPAINAVGANSGFAYPKDRARTLCRWCSSISDTAPILPKPCCRPHLRSSERQYTPSNRRLDCEHASGLKLSSRHIRLRRRLPTLCCLLLISTRVSSIRISLLDKPKSTVCSNTALLFAF